MSHRSGPHPEHPRHHAGHDHGRTAARPAPAPSQGKRVQHGYTLAHAGRQVRIGPVVFWIVAGAIIVMAGWSAATATYFAFRDDVLTRLIARQAEMQYAYEDRISDLRAQVDRATSRQLIDQEQFDRKLDQIQRRQQMLEQRTSTLSGLPDAIPTGAIRPPVRGADLNSPATPKPSPISDTVIFVAPPDREARLESRHIQIAELRSAAPSSPKLAGVDSVLTRLQTSLDKVEGRQLAALSAIEETYDTRMRRMRGVFADLGLDQAEIEAQTPRPAMGGPFVPAKLSSDAGPFERQLYRISSSRAQIERLSRTLSLVPYRKPVVGDVEFSSGFGVRSDPFIGRPAMHTGLDFRASSGDPVRATANGKVVTAGWSGGYGRMVEIEHGNSLSTRYGHLSEIHVKVGDAIRIGQVIGAVGSTGRSTGPHLHYETRVDGEAVDPQKFLRAGVRLGAS